MVNEILRTCTVNSQVGKVGRDGKELTKQLLEVYPYGLVKQPVLHVLRLLSESLQAK